MDPREDDGKQTCEVFSAVRLSDDDFAICADVRRMRPVRRWYRVPLFWELCRNSLSGRPAQVMHMHAEALINQRLVHIDYVSLASVQYRDPGFGLPSGALAKEGIRDPKDGSGYAERSLEVRIFVDGRLVGIGGQCGASAGGTEWSLPAVAVVECRLVISVDDACDEHGPVVELWDVV